MVWMSIALLVVLSVTLLVFRGGKGRRNTCRSASARRTASSSRGSTAPNSALRSNESRGSTDSSQTRAPTRPDGPFAAVAIKPGKNPCSRVLERANVRYLESAAPTVPVLGCDSGNCQCGFTHFTDRRSADESDRRIGIGLRSELYGASGQGERRQHLGRRVGDR